MKRRTASFGGESEGALLARKPGVPQADLDITPMIDVTFLLLIFFMVTSTLQQNTDPQPPTAKHGVGVESRETVVVSILAPKTDTAPTIRLEDGTQLAGTGGLTDFDESRRARLKDETMRAREAGKSRVIIRADRDVPYGFTSKVMRAISEIEGIEFSFEVRDER